MKINIYSEKGSWILSKCARVLQQAAPDCIRWNEDFWETPDICYGINYGYLPIHPLTLNGALFDHFNPDVMGERFIEAAQQADFCVAMSAASRDVMTERLAIPNEKIEVIELGVDAMHQPKLVLGVVGRSKEDETRGRDTRKGRDLLQAFAADSWVKEHVAIRIMGDGWGLPSEPHQLDALPTFYNSLDYILSTATIEGGPMALIEGLACGVKTIIPAIGYACDYPSIHYEVGSLPSLLSVVRDLWTEKHRSAEKLTASVSHMTWQHYAERHLELFERLASGDVSGKLALARSAQRATPRPHREIMDDTPFLHKHFSGSQTLLDVSCGFGASAVSLSHQGHDVVGICSDPSVAELNEQRWERTPRVSFTCAPDGRLPFPDGHFDGAYSLEGTSSLERSPASSLAEEILRVLKPGGRYIVVSPRSGKEVQKRQGTTTIASLSREMKAVGFDAIYSDFRFPRKSQAVLVRIGFKALMERAARVWADPQGDGWLQRRCSLNPIRLVCAKAR